MCYSDNSTNYYQQFIQISIGCIGILSFIAHFIAFILWTTYIVGWRTIIKWKSIQRKRQLNYNFMTTNPSCTILQTMTKVTTTTTTTTTTTAVNTLIHRNDINTSEQIQPMITPKEILIWPNCSLRISIQIIILSMEFINIIGCCTDLIRLIYLSMTGNDLRLLTNDWLCRIQIFLSFISCDISGWHFVCLCIERCYIILFPRNYYSINRTSIKPALIMILFIYFIGILSNLFLLIPNYPVCNEPFKSTLVNTIKFSITFIIPGFTVIISTVLMIVVLIHWKLKNIKSDFINNNNNNTNGSNHHHHHNNTTNNSSNNTSARITVAKMMLICAILYLFILFCLFVFGSIYDDYCCFLVAKTNDHWIDNLFNLLSILYWFVLTITSYVLMLGTITVRHDIKTILLIIWYKIWKRNSFIT
ncbi:unnamed protein product [Schistosoma curassoni]|uniref:G_PROTEIN_RECEP_F1_2 domain-containing protein n=1 Tax=Schistosoma curassoni TaxID=6186 RepID=A0A183K3K2_9TREM|nr:unnamed protein product [Schistosoma curassoni]VDP36137.1 unnamed protein product [Schistosoma curassoni]